MCEYDMCMTVHNDVEQVLHTAEVNGHRQVYPAIQDPAAIEIGESEHGAPTMVGAVELENNCK